ncbi:hypothetical protein V6R21_03485 [Limibacter armeniacum]|uniref:hypothetical protein n=1 Tax=Limibacter armeniacum TaxID=466084 RepID=UPI002FE5D7F2
MKRLKIISLILILFLVSGCSYVSDFFIYNLSNQAITIVYTLTKPSSYGMFITNPDVYKINTENEENKLTKVENEMVKYSSSTQTVTCTINSKEALRIGNEINFTLSNYDERKQIGENVGQLTITRITTCDTLTCNGNYIYLLLSELDDNKFGIRIE